MTPEQFQSLPSEDAIEFVEKRMAEAWAIQRQIEAAMWDEYFRSLLND